ncbi:esterase [Pasteurellaceae bacterium Macca]|nr:esterase [Pasteurellaceae bacterium Macca]
MPQVYIIHGYTASPDNHWFPWLEQALVERGIRCHRLAMPDSQHPTPEKWLDYLKTQIQCDEPTVIVGHSLGCIASLNFLAKQFERPVGGVWVSGFYQPLTTIPELTPFSNLYAILPPLMPFKSYVVASMTDTIVPHQYSDQLAQHLNAEYIRLPEGGHFLDREGYTEFPLVLELVLKLLAESE